MVIQVIEQLNLSENHLLVGCSGGLDSTVLLHAIVQTGLRPEVLHINYQLRGAESEQDEAFVRQIAQKLDLKCTVLRCPTYITKQHGVNLQAAARAFRRQFFDEWIAKSDHHCVVLAHHSDDQEETFFLQLARGAGLFGLGGMQPQNNGYVRPFLSLSKADLHAFALQHHIPWREDRSNSENNYSRNKLRNEILPFLHASQPELKQTILYLQGIFRVTTEDLRTNFTPILERILEQQSVHFSEWQQWSIEQKICFCKTVHWPVWSLERIEKLFLARLSAHFEVGNNVVFRTKKGISWQDKRQPKRYWDFKIHTIENLPTTFSKEELFLNASLIQGSIRLRLVSKNDRIFPVGMIGSQPVLKVLKDAGIAQQEREQCYVLTDNETVLCIPGIKIDRRKIAHADTKSILNIQLFKT